MNIKKAIAIGAMASTLTLSAFVDEVKTNNQEKLDAFNQSKLMQNLGSKNFFTEEDEKDILKMLNEIKKINKKSLVSLSILKFRIDKWKLENPIEIDAKLNEIKYASDYGLKINKKTRKYFFIKDNKKIMKISKEVEKLDLELIQKAKAFKEQIKRNVKIANMLNKIMDKNDEVFKALS